jgi:hypothetical protein
MKNYSQQSTCVLLTNATSYDAFFFRIGLAGGWILLDIYDRLHQS